MWLDYRTFCITYFNGFDEDNLQGSCVQLSHKLASPWRQRPTMTTRLEQTSTMAIVKVSFNCSQKTIPNLKST